MSQWPNKLQRYDNHTKAHLRTYTHRNITDTLYFVSNMCKHAPHAHAYTQRIHAHNRISTHAST